MAQLVCGRCGRRTAPHSTYCPHDKWALYVDMPEGDQRIGAAIAEIEVQRGMHGLLARRRMERDRAHLERSIHDNLERRVAALEKRAEENSDDWEAQRALGLLALVERHFERAHAHLELANRLHPGDYEITINYAISLAQRGQLQPALETLQKAKAAWPGTPALLLNLAMVALEARRPALVLETVAELEKMWQANAALAQDFHDEAQTLRGLALLQEHKPREARHFLQLAAQHTVLASEEAARYDLESDSLVERRKGERRISLSSELPPGIELDRRLTSRRGSGTKSAGDTVASIEYAGDAELEDDEPEAQNGEAGENNVLEGKTADADLLNNLGMAEAASGEYGRAVKRFAAAMRLEPGNARIHNNLGVLAYAQGQLHVAFKHLDIARSIEEFIEKPEPSTFNHLGVVLSAMGRNDESLEEFQKAGAHERAEFEVWYNLGRAYIEHGKPERGVEFLRRAFQADPNDADVHAVLGAAYLLRGQMQLIPEAMKHLKRSLQINSSHRTALADIAMALLEMGQNEQAYRVIQQELKTYPGSAEAMFLMAIVSLRIADEQSRARASQAMALREPPQDDQALARASQLFNKAFDNRPDMLVTLYNMALCQYVVGFRDSAARQLEYVVSRDPSLAPAYYLMGVGHADAKRWKEALEAWQTAAKYEPGNPDLEANMGYIFYQRGDWAQAISHFVKAHRAAPDQADLLSSLGLCYARDKQLNKAIQTFEHSLRLAPHAPVTHSNLGLAFYFQTQVERALDQWRIVSQLDAAYASRREEDQYTNFDDSQISIRPLNWRSRIIRMAPILPPPHTTMVPGYNVRSYRLAISDPAIKTLDEQSHELDVQSRLIGFTHAHK